MKRIFFGPGPSIWRGLFFELTQENSEVEYCDFYNKATTTIKRRLLSARLNKLLPYFVRRIIYRYILNYDFLKHLGRNETVLFAMTNGYEWWGDIECFGAFLDYLKKEYPNAKFAIHLMESMQSLKGKPILDKVLTVLKKFDLVLTFNRYDSKEFGIEYYPPVCENACAVPTGKGESSDLFYVGSTANPNRVNLALSVFKKASDKGLKCIFFFGGKIDAPEFLVSKKDGEETYYTYKNSKIFPCYIPYTRSLSYIKFAKTMLEIVLPVGFASCTARPTQCMTYKVKLLTNCPTVTDESFYSPDNISFFNDENDIDYEFINLPFKGYSQDFSAPRLIEYIEKRLFKD